MKDLMQARFVPTHYNRDVFKKLQQLKQGTKSVEEYNQEMEIAMIRANVKEDEEQTMACFLNGLNYQVKKIADFQPYSNLLELVHQATKVERQVQDDYKYSKFSSKTTAQVLKLLRHLQLRPATSQVTRTRRLRQADQTQAPTSREPHPLPQHRMLPPRQAPSSVSRAKAEATRPSNAQPNAT